MPKTKPRLSVEQIELVAQFADYAFDYFDRTFDEVARKVLGAQPFPNTPTGRKFRREAKEVFDRERES